MLQAVTFTSGSRREMLSENAECVLSLRPPHRVVKGLQTYNK